MDKLKEVLKYQFWIMLGIALILPFVGWIMGTSGMMSEAAERTKALKSLDDQLKATGDDPNADWERQLKEINVQQEKQQLIAWHELYERQKPMMTWPANMVDDPEKIEPLHQEVYRRTGHVSEIERLHKIVKPVDDDWQNGLVKFPEELLPNFQEDWQRYTPTAKQIAAAQEDIWLLDAILRRIAAVNEGASTPYDAPIREIVELLLRGGSPKGSGGGAAKSTTTTAGAGAAGMEKGMMEAMSKMRPLGGAGMGMGGAAGGMGGAPGIADPKINADEDLGEERPIKDATKTASTGSTTTGGAGATAGAGMAKMMEMASLIGPGGAGGGSGMATRGGGANMERYCDEKDEWKTRGFVLQVVMDQQRVPDLIVQLSNCEWPINILRVHVADYQDEDLVSADGSLGGTMSPGRSMSPFGAAGGKGMGATPGMGAPPGMGAAPGGAAGAKPRMGVLPPPKGTTQRAADETGEVAQGSTRSALEDPNLVNVAIVGVIYIFKKPPEPPAATPGAQSPGAVPPGSQPVAASPAASTRNAAAAGTPAAGTGAAAPTDADTAKTPPVAAADEEKPNVKQEDGDQEKGALDPKAADPKAADPNPKSAPEADPKPGK